jgi:hypothetical protein
MELIRHAPNRLYNCDKTGKQNKHTKLIDLKGKHQISALKAMERGCLITVITCSSPSWHYIPPLIITPWKNMKLQLINEAPPGSAYACHPSGWIQTDPFTQWFHNFKRHVKPTEEDPTLLVLDGHSSHTRNKP